MVTEPGAAVTAFGGAFRAEARALARLPHIAHHGEMKLGEKGRYAPAPRLEPAAQRVAETVAEWPGVQARSHWLLGDERVVDGADFYLGEDELGHIHLDSAAHVMHARSIADALIEAGLGGAFEWSREVVVLEIRTERDVNHALWLFELSYARRQGRKNPEILARIAAYAPCAPRIARRA